MSAIEFTRWLSVRNLDREAAPVLDEERRQPQRGLRAI
jgi:hypothetical protein